MKCTIIGAGRLSKNLALTLTAHGHAVLAIANRHLERAQNIIDAIGTGIAVDRIAALPVSDITFIAVADDAIDEVSQSFFKHTPVTEGQIIVHCSGALSSSILSRLHERGCLIASLHPARVFPQQMASANAFLDCDCIVEGDLLAVATLSRLFSNMGANVIAIDDTKKSLYHAAAVMASNYLVTLAHCAQTLFSDAGLTSEAAKQITQNLMTSSLSHIKVTSSLSDALTGPLARGDSATIVRHTAAMPATLIKRFYCAAGLATLPLTRLDTTIMSQLEQHLFTQED